MNICSLYVYSYLSIPQRKYARYVSIYIYVCVIEIQVNILCIQIAHTYVI